jgi:hypothetical protein
MRKELKLTYEGKEYVAAVNINATRAYARERGLKTVQDFQNDLLYTGKGEDIPFEVLERYALFFLCAIREGARLYNEPCTLTLEDVFLLMEESKEYLHEIMTMTFDEPDPSQSKKKAATSSVKKK